MKRLLLLSVAGALALAFAGKSFGRGGGGCLERGTPVLTPAGDTPVEALKAGDLVLASRGGRLIPAAVQSVFQVQPEIFIELAAGGRRLKLTPAHPVAVAPGVFKTAASLRAGDSIQALGASGLQLLPVASVTPRRALAPAYDLLVAPGGTYLAGGLLVHNKGCFLPATPIRRADGSEIPISRVQPGDALLAFTPAGVITNATVQKVLTNTADAYLVVTTEKAVLRVTLEHPFYTGAGIFKTLEALAPGDTIYAFDGRGLSPQRITKLETVAAKTAVYNLQTDSPNTFFANGVAVHNKGGGGGHGGGHGGGRGGGSDNPLPALFFLGGIIALMIVVKWFENKSKTDEDLDFLYSPAQVARKKDKTLKLLEFLARQDAAVSPATLAATARTTFTQLQQCWQARDYAPMKPLMMPALFDEHVFELQGMVRNHEINIVANLKIEQIDLVNIRYTLQPQDREFTALITASAADYYVDDRSRQWLRGDQSPARFQEFWTFHYQAPRWLLREIEQTRESDALKEDNFFEQFTDLGVDQIYGQAAGKEGPAGPWLERGAEIKETRIERLLNFLVQTDQLWDRTRMLETARTTFLQILRAWETGDAAVLAAAALFPDLAADLRQEIETRRAGKIALEFRNVCVRKAELVLVRNFADNARDEYVARLRAHAQKIIRQAGQTVHEDPYVAPFEQYLTFGRLNNAWKLKEIVKPADAAGLMRKENLDQDSGPELLQWYYEHKRAV